MLNQKDKQAHFFAMLSAMLCGALFHVSLIIMVPLLLSAALMWEYKDYKLKQKDFGELSGMVKYDWADFMAFVLGIVAGAIISLIAANIG